MANGRGRQMWEQTSALLAMQANVNRDPKKRPTPFSPAEFNPYAIAKKKRAPKMRMKDVKGMFHFGAKRPRR